MLIAALAPLVAVPLGVITFYLRSLYENQMNRHAELVRRFERVERMSGDLVKTVSSFAIDYTTKEEWLRECMYARGRIERLGESLAQIGLGTKSVFTTNPPVSPLGKGGGNSRADASISSPTDES